MSLPALALPPQPMPSHHRGRPLKAWRYVGVYGPELMLCVGAVRIGAARQAFWAVWDRNARRLDQRTTLGRGGVELAYGRATVADRGVRVVLELDETDGIETICPTGRSYAWTRKQGGIEARGEVRIGDVTHTVAARAVIDDTAAYYERHTRWRWSAGVGTADDGREVAWNLVAGVNDPPHNSERSVWIDGIATEVAPVAFTADERITFAGRGELRFTSEAVRRRRENLLLVRSSYRQPFGTFSGELPGQVGLAEGYGVMEEHDVFW